MRSYGFWYKIALGILSFGLMAFVFKTSLGALLLFTLVIAAMLLNSKLLLSYAAPAKWLYRYRFLAYGLAHAVFNVALVAFLIFDKKSFGFWVWFFAVVGVGLGIAFFYWLSFQKTKKRIGAKHKAGPKLYDAVMLKDSQNQTFYGRLFLTENTLSFYPLAGKKPYTEIDVQTAEPELIRNKTFGFPVGLYFPHHDIKAYINFPLFWLKVLEKREVNSLIA